MIRKHQYNVKIEWTGNKGNGTLNYKSYTRDHLISTDEKEINIPASSDPSFLGDKTKYNPEELLVASISSCHMLWYLHLCAKNKIIVTEYRDQATGIMEEQKDGSGKFKAVTLNPIVTIQKENMLDKATELHREANRLCFIANSVNFNVLHNPAIIVS